MANSSLAVLVILAALSPEVAAKSFLRGLFSLNCSFNAQGEVVCDEPTYDNQEENQAESGNKSGLSNGALASAIIFPFLAVALLALLVWWFTCRGGGRRNNKSRAVKNFEKDQANETDESDEEEPKQKEQPTTSRFYPLRTMGSVEVESVASEGTDTKTGTLCCSFS